MPSFPCSNAFAYLVGIWQSHSPIWINFYLLLDHVADPKFPRETVPWGENAPQRNSPLWQQFSLTNVTWTSFAPSRQATPRGPVETTLVGQPSRKARKRCALTYVGTFWTRKEVPTRGKQQIHHIHLSLLISSHCRSELGCLKCDLPQIDSAVHLCWLPTLMPMCQ